MPLAASGEDAAVEELDPVRPATSGSSICCDAVGTSSRVGPEAAPRASAPEPGAAVLVPWANTDSGEAGLAELAGRALAAGSRARTAAIEPAVRPTPIPGPATVRCRPHDGAAPAVGAARTTEIA